MSNVNPLQAFTNVPYTSRIKIRVLVGKINVANLMIKLPNDKTMMEALAERDSELGNGQISRLLQWIQAQCGLHGC